MTPDPRLLALPLLLLASCGREPAPEQTADPAAASSGTAPAAPPVDAASLEAARRWMTYQYLSRDPERAPEMVDARWHLENPDANALGVLSVFLGHLGSIHPGVLDAWTDAATAETMPTEGRVVFAYAVWAAEPGVAGPRIDRVARGLPEQEVAGIAELTLGDPPDLAALEPETSVVLDFWWAAFMAEGDLRWVELVLGLIPTPEMSVEEAGLDDPQRLEVARAAAWSLTSNAAQHPRVLEHLRGRLDEAGPWPTVAEILRQAEQAAQKNPPVLPEG